MKPAQLRGLDLDRSIAISRGWTFLDIREGQLFGLSPENDHIQETSAAACDRPQTSGYVLSPVQTQWHINPTDAIELFEEMTNIEQDGNQRFQLSRAGIDEGDGTYWAVSFAPAYDDEGVEIITDPFPEVIMPTLCETIGNAWLQWRQRRHPMPPS